jgi:hypothetical protein
MLRNLKTECHEDLENREREKAFQERRGEEGRASSGRQIPTRQRTNGRSRSPYVLLSHENSRVYTLSCRRQPIPSRTCAVRTLSGLRAQAWRSRVSHHNDVSAIHHSSKPPAGHIDQVDECCPGTFHTVIAGPTTSASLTSDQPA